MKISFIGTYLRMLQVGNGLSDHDQILKRPRLMTTNEMVRLALALDTEVEFNLVGGRRDRGTESR